MKEIEINASKVTINRNIKNIKQSKEEEEIQQASPITLPCRNFAHIYSTKVSIENNLNIWRSYYDIISKILAPIAPA